MSTGRRPVPVLWIALLLGGCGESAPSVPLAPSAPMTEEGVAQIEEQIRKEEGAFLPLSGTSRAEVERRYGTGRPTVASKIPAPVPPDSRLVAYEVGAVGLFLVQYDRSGKVAFAHVTDPTSTKGTPVGRVEPLEQRHREATLHLDHVRRVRRALAGGTVPR